MTTQLDRFAQLLSDSEGTEWDGNVSEIARRMGLDPSRGNGLLQRLRREVGLNRFVETPYGNQPKEPS